MTKEERDKALKNRRWTPTKTISVVVNFDDLEQKRVVDPGVPLCYCGHTSQLKGTHKNGNEQFGFLVDLILHPTGYSIDCKASAMVKRVKVG
jgi:hypothetical protein